MSFHSSYALAPLASVAQFINGDRSANYPKGDDYVATGIPFISAADLGGGQVDYTSARQISEGAYQRLRSGKIQTDDVLFCLRGSIGKIAYIKEAQIGAIASSLVIIRATERIDPRYLFFGLSSQAGQQAAAGLNNGAAQPNLSVGELQKIEMPLPAMRIQRRIAGILSAYDDLIENSQRRIKILEEMARRLYREWFVHFRFQGHESVPLVPSPLGEIPRGWEVKKLPECVRINPRVVVPREGEKPFVPMGCLSNDSMLISDVESRAGNSGAKFQNGDTLLARITPCLENGKTGFVQFLPDENAVAFGSTEFIVLRSHTLTAEFVYCLARSDEFRGVAIKSMSGASGRQRVQEQCFNDFLIVQPTRKVLEDFSSIIAPSFQLIFRLHRQIQNLRHTRDLLLPRLLSGQVALKSEAT